MQREKYFTRESIAATAKAMANELAVKDDASAFCLADAAMLVIDMQQYFLAAGSHAYLPAAPAIVPNIHLLLSAFRKAGRPVFFTRHGNRPQDAGQMASWWHDLLGVDHPLGVIETSLQTHAEQVIVKTQYDAFYNTDLEARLRQAGTGQLLITGVATHLCCESTARSAFVRGFAVFIAIDATATWNRELHVASLRGLAHGCVVPRLTCALLAGRPGSCL